MKFLCIVLLGISQAFATELRDFRGRVDHTPPRPPYAMDNWVERSFTYALKPQGQTNIELTMTRTVPNPKPGTFYPPVTERTQYRLNQVIVGRRYSRQDAASMGIPLRGCTYVMTRAVLSNGVLQLTDYHIHKNGCPSDRSVLAEFNAGVANPNSDYLRGRPRATQEFHLVGGLLKYGAPQSAVVEEVIPVSSAHENLGVNETDRNIVNKNGTTRSSENRSYGASEQ
jgi:hypothetical protein